MLYRPDERSRSDGIESSGAKSNASLGAGGKPSPVLRPLLSPNVPDAALTSDPPALESEGCGGIALSLPESSAETVDHGRGVKPCRASNPQALPSSLLSAGGRRTRTSSRPQTADGQPVEPPVDGVDAASASDAPPQAEEQWPTNWAAVLRSPPPSAPAKVRCDMSGTVGGAQAASIFASPLAKKPLSCTLGAVPNGGSRAVSSPLRPVSLVPRSSHSRPTSSSCAEKDGAGAHCNKGSFRKEGQTPERNLTPTRRTSRPQSRPASRPPSRDSLPRQMAEAGVGATRARDAGVDDDSCEMRLSTINILRLSDNGIGEEMEEWSGEHAKRSSAHDAHSLGADESPALDCRLQCVQVGSTSLSLKLVPVLSDEPVNVADSDCHAFMFQLQLYRSADGSADGSFHEVYTGTSPCHEVRDLRPARAYRFRCRTQLQRSPRRRDPLVWSEWHEAVFTCDCAPPLQPHPLTLADNGAGSHTLRLLCTGLDGCGAAINCVRLEAQTGSIGMEETFYQSFPGVQPGSTMTILAARGLTPNSTYRMRARGGNRKGEGPWSASATFRTLPESAEPMAPPRAWSKSAHSVLLVWLAPGAGSSASAAAPSAALQYELQMTTNGGEDAPHSRGDEWRPVYFGRECKFEAINLEPATRYSFRLRAEGSGEMGGCGWSEPLVVLTDPYVPSAPEPPALVRRDGRNMHLEWIAPADNGRPLIHHELQVEPQGAMAPPRVFSIAHPPSATHSRTSAASHASDGGLKRGARVLGSATGLPPGSQCLFRVRAVNAVGAGPWSAPVRFCTESAPPEVPTHLAVQATGERWLRVGWQPVESSGGKLVQYELHVACSDTTTLTPRQLWSSSNENGCEVRDLRPDTSYVVYVRAYNDTGPSEWSEPLRARTATALVEPPPAPHVISKTSTTMQIGWSRRLETGGEGFAELTEETPYEEAITWELQMDGGIRCLMNSDGYEDQSWGDSRHMRLKGFEFDPSLVQNLLPVGSSAVAPEATSKQQETRAVARVEGRLQPAAPKLRSMSEENQGKGGLKLLDRKPSGTTARGQLPPLHARNGGQTSMADVGVAEEVMDEEVVEELQEDAHDGEFDTVMQGEPGLLVGLLGASLKEDMDEIADEIPEEVGHLADGLDDEDYRVDEEYHGEEPAEDYVQPADEYEADVPAGDGDVEQDGVHKYRLVYQGASRSFTITELSPACRYCFRLRYQLEEGSSGWSAILAAETDAADSAHRIDFEALSVFERLGEGAFSVVYRGTFNVDSQAQQVAVKRLKYQHLNDELVAKFNQEIAIISKVRHRNVVSFVGAVTEQPNLCVVMEFMEGGSLNQAIHKNKVELPLPRLLQIAMDVAQGCHYLHRQKPMIIHRDLKSQNILLTGDGVAKIADFGLSRFFQQDVASMTGQVGTPGWTAPEVFKHNSYNHKVDVYSFGVVLAECLSGEKPYAGMDAMQIAFATVYRNKRPPLPATVPAPLQKLISSCWDADPKKRPPFSRVIDSLRAIERIILKLEVRMRIQRLASRPFGFDS